MTVPASPAPPPAPAPAPVAAPRVPLVSRLLIGAVALLTVLALLGTWVDRQLLNGDDWKRTSAALLREDAIRVPLADVIAAQIADGSRASAAVEELGASLPPRFVPLTEAASGLAATATRDAVQRATQRVLANASVQDAWIAATGVAQQQLVRLIEGENLEQDGDTIYLDLRPVAVRVARELGFDGTRIAALPADRTRVALMPADRLQTLQTAGGVLNALAWIPAILALLLAALAVRLARGDARRTALLAVGATIVGSAVLTLALQRLAGRELVGALTAGGPTQPAAEAAWRIAGSLLVSLCVVLIAIGLLVMLGAWMVGPGSRAIRLRAVLRPWVVERPWMVYGAVAVAYLAVVVWGPLAVFAKLWPVALLAALLAAGLWVLHRRLLTEGDGPRDAPAAGAPEVR